jgi:tetratricopeptide (TPR) repeat protein
MPGHGPLAKVAASANDANITDRLNALPPDEAGDATRAVLRVLAVAEGPLTIDDVAGILGLSKLRFSRVIEPFGDLLSLSSWELGMSAPVRQTVSSHFGEQELRESKRTLARWCAEVLAFGRRSGSFPDYVLRHGAATLAAINDSRALAQLVDREWMRLSATRTGSLSAFTRDMQLAAQAAACASPPDRIQELRASLAAVSAAAIAADVPPEALGVLAKAGRRETAMDLAAMVAPEARSDAYRRIATALDSADDDAAVAVAEAIASGVACVRESGNHYPLLEVARSLGKSGNQDWAVRALAALRAEAPAGPGDVYLAREIMFLAVEILTSAGDVDGAWQAARGIPDSWSRDLALSKFVVTALAQASRVQDAVDAARTVEGDAWGLIGDIAAITAESGDVASTISVLESVPSEYRQHGVITAGTALARAGRVGDVLDILRLIDDVDRRADTARLLASTLAETGHVDEALAVARTIGDADRREHAVRSLAQALARTGRAGRASALWTAESTDRNKDYFAAELAKTAAEAGDVDGALQVAGAIGSKHARDTAITHAGNAAARDGDFRRATALVRVIGSGPGEEHALAVIAADLAARHQYDGALAVIDIISGAQPKSESQLALAVALAGEGEYSRAAPLAKQAADAAGPLGSNAGHARALMTWARSLALSSSAGEALIPAEQAATLAGESDETELLADALGIWSGTLALSGRAADASAVAARAIAAVDDGDASWPDTDHYRRDRRAKSVAVIFAEAGQSDLAVSTSLKLAHEWEQDSLLSEVAGILAKRGLADQAIAAVKASPQFASYTADIKLRELVRILARHGHADGALRAADAIAGLEDRRYADFTVSSMVCEAVRILAENGWVDAALAAAGASTPEWNRPAAFTAIACAVALAGDIGRAANIAETAAGPSALAKVADALMQAGQLDEAARLADEAVRLALGTRPASPDTSYAYAALDRLAGASEPRDATQQPDDAASPAGDGSTDAARQAVADARDIADPGRRALLLGNAAKAFALAGEHGPAAETAGECLRMAAELPFADADPGAMLALGVLLDVGQVAEALAGIGALKRDGLKAEALCAVARRLAEQGLTGDLRRLAEGTGVSDHIANRHQRITALSGIGRSLAEAHESQLANNVADEVSRQARELTEPHEKACALADQAELLAWLGRCAEAVDFAAQALATAEEPLRGWRDQVISTAVKALVRCHKVDDAADAVRAFPAATQLNCVAEVGAALLDAGDRERAATLVSETLAALGAAGGRAAFYDLICTQLPQYPALFRTWLGTDADLIRVSRELAAIERWWADLA